MLQILCHPGLVRAARLRRAPPLLVRDLQAALPDGPAAAGTALARDRDPEPTGPRGAVVRPEGGRG